jgi:hypothetical protein
MSQAHQVQDMQEQLSWHWRNSMRVIRFFSFDARASMPLPLLLVYARPSTLMLTIFTLMLFRFFERKGLTFPAALRAGRAAVVAFFFGGDRPGLIGAYRRQFRDFG